MTVDARKEAKRMKLLNIYGNDQTGEKICSFITGKRLKEVGTIYNKIRNSHRFTFQYEQEDKKHLKKIGDEYAMQCVLIIKYSSIIINYNIENVNNIQYQYQK